MKISGLSKAQKLIVKIRHRLEPGMTSLTIHQHTGFSGSSYSFDDGVLQVYPALTANQFSLHSPWARAVYTT